MKTPPENREAPAGLWDEEHVKALLHFPRFPVRLIQQEPWQTWIAQRGGLKAVYAYLQNYPLFPSHRRILEVVLSNPEEIADAYANRLHISRATYFYQLRELLPALVQALNLWELGAAPDQPIVREPPVSAPAALPTPLTSLIGAEPVLQTLIPLLLREDVRLLTLLGPGGIGKTRLSIELARRISDEVANEARFIDLSPLRATDQVIPTIAQALGLKDTETAPLKTYLQPRKFLLVLDNFEHLLPAASSITDLLSAAPQLKIVVTSRAALRIYGEHQFAIPPLAAPAMEHIRDPKILAQAPAVALFVQRAQAVNANFQLTHENVEAVCELCLRMEGIPLAIELAAFQVKYFSPQAMLVRLANSRRLNFLSQGPKRLHPHQQTPRAILDWSYQLLTPDLQKLFYRLAVFNGGCTIEAAAAVCSTTESDAGKSPAVSRDQPIAFSAQLGLTALADQSLLQQQVGPDGEPRFHMPGLTREYALEQLERQAETFDVERAHALYYLGLAEQLAPPQEVRVRQNWIEALQHERLNLQSAIQWVLDHREGELGLRFVTALWYFWKVSGYQHEGRQIAQAVLEQTAAVQQPIRAQVLRLTGWLAHDLRDYTTMVWAFQASLDLCETLGDAQGAGLARQGLGELAQLRGQWAVAHEHIQHCLMLFRSLDDTRQIAWAFDLMGRLALGQGNLAEAQTHFQNSAERLRSIASQAALSFALGHLGQALLYQGQSTPATALFAESLALSSAAGNQRGPMVALAHNYLAEIAIQEGQLTQAQEQLEACLVLSKEAGYTWCTELGSFTAGLLALRQNDPFTAATCFRESLFFQQSLKEYWRALTLIEMVAVWSETQHDWLGAARLFGAAEQLRQSLQVRQLPLYRPLYEQSLAQLTTRLNSAALHEARAAGQSLSLEQTILYAVRCLE